MKRHLATLIIPQIFGSGQDILSPLIENAASYMYMRA